MDYHAMRAPRFLLWEDLPVAQRRIDDILADATSMVYDEKVGKMAMVTLTIANKGYKYSGDARFDRSWSILLAFGYPDSMSTTKRVIVRGAVETYDSKGFPIVTMTGFDVGSELARGSAAYNWGRRPTSQIASSIAKRYGLRPFVQDSDDARPQAYVQPAGVGDYDYLSRLATDIGWDFYVDGDELHYEPYAINAEPVGVYRFFTDRRGPLLSFTPAVKTARPPNVAVGGTGADGRTPTQADGSSSRTSEAEAVYAVNFDSARGGFVNRPIRREPVVHPTAETDESRQRRLASAMRTKMEREANKASAVLVGQPRVKARSMLKFDLPNPKYSGVWRVEHVEHSIAMGGPYLTTLKELSRRGTGAGTERAVAPSREAQNPRAQDRYSVDFDRARGGYERVPVPGPVRPVRGPEAIEGPGPRGGEWY